MKHMFKTITCVAALISLPAFSAGLDDIQNYQKRPIKNESNGTQPYTTQEIIRKIYTSIDEKGVYKGKWVDGFNDPKAIAFDEAKFGKCEYFHMRFNGKMGGSLFDGTLRFLFPKDENQKAAASSAVKQRLEAIENANNSEYRTYECADWRESVAKLKDILNVTIEAAPAILKEKQKAAEIAEVEKNEKLKVDAEKTSQLQQAREKVIADRAASDLVVKEGRKEREIKLENCRNTNEYKLYKISEVIESNNSMARNAEATIKQEKEAEKISGFVNKQVMYQMGNVIVGANKLNKDNFEIYKKLDGAARNFESVKALINPCSF